MKDIIIIFILLVVLGGALFYIIKSKKKGARCIGCSSGGCCPSKVNECSCKTKE